MKKSRKLQNGEDPAIPTHMTEELKQIENIQKLNTFSFHNSTVKPAS